jgi:hypothetical protein
MNEEEELFSEDPIEHFRIENEILKMKLKAQYGDAFQMFNSGEPIPPEVENQFLKNMINFEEHYDKVEFIQVLEKIGNPIIKPLENLLPTQIKKETEFIMDLLNKQDVFLDFNDGPYDEAIIYKFLTEELMFKEIEKEMPEGMSCNFIYEEFHPNHRADITKVTHDFVVAWVTGNVEKIEYNLSEAIIDDEANRYTKEQVLKKISNIFEAFDGFKDDGFNVDEVDFTFIETDETGMGNAEGHLKFDAIMENGDVLHFEGPYKLYFTYEHNNWNIFYFVMPSFSW